MDQEVPQELITEILSFLPSNDASRASLTCKSFYEAGGRTYLWDVYLKRDWLDSADTSSSDNSNNQQQTDSSAAGNSQTAEADTEELETTETQESDALLPTFTEIELRSSKQIYLDRMAELLQWTHNYKLIKYNLQSTTLPFHQRFLFQCKLAFRGLFNLLFSTHPIYFVTPRFLHKDYVDDHFQQLVMCLNSSRAVLDLLSLLFVICALYFNIFAGEGYLTMTITEQATYLLLLTLFGCIVAFNSQRLKVRVANQNAQRQGVSVEHFLVVPCQLLLCAAFNYTIYHVEQQVPFKSLIIVILSILHAVDQMLPVMIFETYYKTPKADTNEGILKTIRNFFTDESRTVMAKKYMGSKVTFFSAISVPSILLVAVVIAGSGKSGIVATLAFIALALVSLLTLDGRAIGRAIGLNPVGTLFILLAVAVNTTYMVILYLKMRFCWNMKQQELQRNITQPQRFNNSSGLVLLFQCLSYCMIAVLVASVATCLLYF